MSDLACVVCRVIACFFLRAMCARRIHAGLVVHVVFMVETVFKSDVFHDCAVSAQCLLRYRDP